MRQPLNVQLSLCFLALCLDSFQEPAPVFQLNVPTFLQIQSGENIASMTLQKSQDNPHTCIKANITSFYIIFIKSKGSPSKHMLLVCVFMDQKERNFLVMVWIHLIKRIYILKKGILAPSTVYISLSLQSRGEVGAFLQRFIVQ
ncbi:hypothetical protein AMECASPLE_039052 [Ameca splendens]|uniref:Uncharacterized protein n=1 Tax=Ameca splendens TaxID=208324 RepID=A0ABV0YVY6_9TELE